MIVLQILLFFSLWDNVASISECMSHTNNVESEDSHNWFTYQVRFVWKCIEFNSLKL